MAIEPSISPEVLNGALPSIEEGIAVGMESPETAILDMEDGGIMIDFESAG